MRDLPRIARHVLIGLAAVAVIVVSGFVIVANSDAYRFARHYVATHPKVIAALGEGVETRLKWGGRFKTNVSEAHRWMRLILHAKGAKASGTATVEMSRKDSAAWVVERAELNTSRGDIVLLPPAGR